MLYRSGGGAGGPTGGVTVPGSEPRLGTTFVILKLLKMVGQYSFTTLSSAPKPMRYTKTAEGFPGGALSVWEVAIRQAFGHEPAQYSLTS